MTKIVFSFDVEDYVNPHAADGILYCAEILRKTGIRGCFNIVARLAQALVKWGRTDIIEALKYHELDLHSLAHSYHPTINEYTDLEDYEAAKAESLANFEENRGRNTYAKAKADAKKNRDDAHMRPSERAAKEQEARDTRIAEAKKRTEEANARYNAAKK